MNRISEQLQLMASDTDQLISLRNQVTTHMQEVTFHLQFQDRVSQVLEHILDALGEMSHMSNEERYSNPDLLKSERQLIDFMQSRATTNLERNALGMSTSSFSGAESELTIF